MDEGENSEPPKGLYSLIKSKIFSSKSLTPSNLDEPKEEEELKQERIINQVFEKIAKETQQFGYIVSQKSKDYEGLEYIVRLIGGGKFYEAIFNTYQIFSGEDQIPYNSSVGVTVVECEEENIRTSRKPQNAFAYYKDRMKEVSAQVWRTLSGNDREYRSLYSTYKDVPNQDAIRTSFIHNSQTEENNLNPRIRSEGMNEGEQLAILKRILDTKIDPDRTEKDYRDKAAAAHFKSIFRNQVEFKKVEGTKPQLALV